MAALTGWCKWWINTRGSRDKNKDRPQGPATMINKNPQKHLKLFSQIHKYLLFKIEFVFRTIITVPDFSTVTHTAHTAQEARLWCPLCRFRKNLIPFGSTLITYIILFKAISQLPYRSFHPFIVSTSPHWLFLDRARVPRDLDLADVARQIYFPVRRNVDASQQVIYKQAGILANMNIRPL